MKHPVGEQSSFNIATTPQEDSRGSSGASHSEEEKRGEFRKYWGPILLWLFFFFGFGTGYLLWGRHLDLSPARGETQTRGVSGGSNFEGVADLVREINPPEGYKLPVSFGDIGPQLLKAGAIDLARFEETYRRAGKPLSDAQRAILQEGGDRQVVIRKDNAYFLLNFFWALGLTNHNPILTEGQMMQGGVEQVGRYASTGGWTLGTKPSTELYASEAIIPLTADQQARVEQVASNVYRPCCNNPTSFPDCNHGMAMLGLLELMASQGASVDQMFEAAKYVNAFWFPQQSLELATFYKTAQGLDFADVDARQIVGPGFSSASGFRNAHEWLMGKGLIEQSPGAGSNCGV